MRAMSFDKTQPTEPESSRPARVPLPFEASGSRGGESRAESRQSAKPTRIHLPSESIGDRVTMMPEDAERHGKPGHIVKGDVILGRYEVL